MAFDWFEESGVRLRVQHVPAQSASGGGPVVLIHGLSGSAHWWRYNVRALSREHDVYLLDLAGYGGAWRQRAPGVQEIARLVLHWLEAHDLRDVTLIGHSMGGQISMHVASLAGDRVRNLVLACASGLLKTSVLRTALKLPRAGMAGRPAFMPRLIADAVRAGPRNLWSSTRDLLKDSVEDLLPGLRARTLVVWGTRDALVPVTLGRLLAGAIPGAIFHEFPRAGHVVMVDAPREFNELVLAFLHADRRR